mmetsp:Transcript_30104/g.82616  ORF Transcript_30104/g.82616 Transcript_30104/m.82616 type:complete len:219 (-) Transcript_30104:501-1157(-)
MLEGSPTPSDPPRSASCNASTLWVQCRVAFRRCAHADKQSRHRQCQSARPNQPAASAEWMPVVSFFFGYVASELRRLLLLSSKLSMSISVCDSLSSCIRMSLDASADVKRFASLSVMPTPPQSPSSAGFVSSLRRAAADMLSKASSSSSASSSKRVWYSFSEHSSSRAIMGAIRSGVLILHSSMWICSCENWMRAPVLGSRSAITQWPVRMPRSGTAS